MNPLFKIVCNLENWRNFKKMVKIGEGKKRLVRRVLLFVT